MRRRTGTNTHKSFFVFNSSQSCAHNIFSLFISNLIIIIQRKRFNRGIFRLLLHRFRFILLWMHFRFFSLSLSRAHTHTFCMRPGHARHIESTTTVRQEFSVNFVASQNERANYKSCLWMASGDNISRCRVERSASRMSINYFVSSLHLVLCSVCLGSSWIFDRVSSRARKCNAIFSTEESTHSMEL